MQLSRSIFTLAFMGALFSQAGFAFPAAANLENFKKAAVAGTLFYAVKTLKDRKVDATANKALHTQGLDVATKTVQWIDNNKLALFAGFIGATVVANLIPLPAAKAS